jgi:FAD/FMN-containing dehydrogenase
MSTQIVASWGNVIRAEHRVFPLRSRHDSFPETGSVTTVLPYGNGRSYGDSCLNVGAGLLLARSLDRFISFDANTGVLCCEAGVLLADILRLAVPTGWFVPVTPGTCYVTVGGAIANDVHGKNHHGAGTFAKHIRRMELLRSDGNRIQCSATENPEWFAATVGGLGLTGMVTWAEIQLRRIASPYMDVETIRFGNLDEFLALCAESDRDYEYTVSWVDCAGSGSRLGRGIFQRANHASWDGPPLKQRFGFLNVPFMLPFSLINGASVTAFNTVYFHRHSKRCKRTRTGFAPFFYPLDGILHWNRLYGPRGMYQYQCVIPPAAGRDAIHDLLETIARSGLGSFLSVLKTFGPVTSPGMLSFPREGITLAIDFTNRGARLSRLFTALDSIVSSAGGRLYPAKDGRMPGNLFRSGYPRWPEFSRYIDPMCCSTFWRRVMEGQ